MPGPCDEHLFVARVQAATVTRIFSGGRRHVVSPGKALLNSVAIIPADRAEQIYRTPLNALLLAPKVRGAWQ